MNHVTLIGRLTKDPEVRYTQSGTPVGTFTLAVDRRVQKDKPKEADFIPCVVWSKTAEVVGNYCKKGKQIAVEGRIQVRSYDAKDGSKRYVTEVIVSELELLGSKNDGADRSGNGHKPLTDEDIPF
nr:MAG TPA: Single strand binding protein [Caudoviricetes sp.]